MWRWLITLTLIVIAIPQSLAQASDRQRRWPVSDQIAAILTAENGKQVVAQLTREFEECTATPNQNGQCITLMIALATANFQAGEYRAAETLAAQLMKETQTFGTSGERTVSKFVLGRSLFLAGKLKDAISSLQQAMIEAEANPDLSAIANYSAEYLAIALKIDGNCREASLLAPKFRVRLDWAIQSLKCYFEETVAARGQGDWERGERISNEVIRGLESVNYSDIYVYYGHLAYFLKQQGRNLECISALRLAIAAYPRAQYKKPMELMLLEMQLANQLMFFEPDRSDPENPSFKETNKRDAAQIYLKFIEEYSQNPEAQGILTFAYAGMATLKGLEKRYADQERYIRLAIKSVDVSRQELSERYEIYIRLAYFLEARGRVEEAERQFAYAWRAGTSPGATRDRAMLADWDMGAFYQRTGRPREAWPFLARAQKNVVGALASNPKQGDDLRRELIWKRLYFVKFIRANWDVSEKAR